MAESAEVDPVATFRQRLADLSGEFESLAVVFGLEANEKTFTTSDPRSDEYLKLRTQHDGLIKENASLRRLLEARVSTKMEAPLGWEPTADSSRSRCSRGPRTAPPLAAMRIPDPRSECPSESEHSLSHLESAKLHDSNGIHGTHKRLREHFSRLDSHQKGFLNVEDIWKLPRVDKFYFCEEDVSQALFHVCTLLTEASRSSVASALPACSVCSHGLTFEQFRVVMEGLNVKAKHDKHCSRLRKVFAHEAKDHCVEEAQQTMTREQELIGPQVGTTTLFLLDLVPAVAIIANAVVIGVSADMDEELMIWDICEIFFTMFFAAEFAIKLRIFGCREYCIGASWYWNHFDMFCLITALIDMSITYGQKLFSDGDGGIGSEFMLIKMLRLARLARLVRLLRFAIFRELKDMVQGVVSGVRVLFWAIVLLFFVIFILGIGFRKMVSTDFIEFNSLPSSMFTLFRCFTDGCSSYKGTPLTESLREEYGMPFMIVYILIFLFITIGLFNLIMAIFIDHVVTAHVRRKQQELGENQLKMEVRIKEVITDLIKASNRKRHPSMMNDLKGGARGFVSGLAGKLDFEDADTKERKLQARRTQLHEEVKIDEVMIPREVFNLWLEDPHMLELLEEVEIETSTKSELFDVLDVDMGGELGMDELVGGLMRLRGPISKADIIAIRMGVHYMIKMLEEVVNTIKGEDD
eukprot:TRINITY_DN46527_c0_g1_i1.p1 TRINITY_DN46527_c0_g1~~TRINITY_DN46527_c0_g1_i1.p1  ORF type:complete len:784 (+),score=124.94 TRINITY_DN46527_c0_g1_i1:271-2352(+)